MPAASPAQSAAVRRVRAARSRERAAGLIAGGSTPAGPSWQWSRRRRGGQGRRAPARSRSSASGGVSPLPGSVAAVFARRRSRRQSERAQEPEPMLGEESGKEQEQVQDREAEELLRRAHRRLALAGPEHLQGKLKHGETAEDRDDRVGKPGE